MALSSFGGGIVDYGSHAIFSRMRMEDDRLTPTITELCLEQLLGECCKDDLIKESCRMILAGATQAVRDSWLSPGWGIRFSRQLHRNILENRDNILAQAIPTELLNSLVLFNEDPSFAKECLQSLVQLREAEVLVNSANEIEEWEISTDLPMIVKGQSQTESDTSTISFEPVALIGAKPIPIVRPTLREIRGGESKILIFQTEDDFNIGIQCGLTGELNSKRDIAILNVIGRYICRKVEELLRRYSSETIRFSHSVNAYESMGQARVVLWIATRCKPNSIQLVASILANEMLSRDPHCMESCLFDEIGRVENEFMRHPAGFAVTRSRAHLSLKGALFEVTNGISFLKALRFFRKSRDALDETAIATLNRLQPCVWSLSGTSGGIEIGRKAIGDAESRKGKGCNDLDWLQTSIAGVLREGFHARTQFGVNSDLNAVALSFRLPPICASEQAILSTFLEEVELLPSLRDRGLAYTVGARSDYCVNILSLYGARNLSVWKTKEVFERAVGCVGDVPMSDGDLKMLINLSVLRLERMLLDPSAAILGAREYYLGETEPPWSLETIEDLWSLNNDDLMKMGEFLTEAVRSHVVISQEPSRDDEAACAFEFLE